MAMTGSDGTVAGPGPVMLEPGSGSSTGFRENLGQFHDGNVMYYQRLSDGGIAFERDGIVMTVMEPVDGERVRYLLDPTYDRREAREELVSIIQQESAGHSVRLTFEGANDVEPVGRLPLEGVHNYFIGNDPGAWTTGVREFSQVVYEDLWEGIDLVYLTTDAGLKYEFRVSPGASVSTIP